MNRPVFFSYHSLLGPSGDLDETWRDYRTGHSPLRPVALAGRMPFARTMGVIPERFGLPDPLQPSRYGERLKAGIALVLADLAAKKTTSAFDAVYVGQGRARLTPGHRTVSEFLDWLALTLRENGIAVPRENCACFESSCATGIALARAGARRIAQGRYENVLLLSFDPISPAPLFALDALGVLSRKAKPEAYSEERDGFAPCEAICAAALSARPQAEPAPVALRSAALSTDGGLTGMESDGRGLARCLWQVMRECEIKEPSFIKTHGTGTRMNDEVEGEVLERVFAESSSLPLVSFKPQFGHALNGSGLFEMILAVHVLQEDLLMPTLNLNTPKPLKRVRVLERPLAGTGLRSCLGLAMGFGGVNAAYCLEKPA